MTWDARKEIVLNILHMKYAVEIAKTRSISKAAEALFIAQPNLSRCIKELENELGIPIFERSFKGMSLTPEGEEFIRYASKALQQIEAIERKYRDPVPCNQTFSISVPRASYIADAFAQFSRQLTNAPAEVYYMETNSSRAISNILNEDYHLGIIRYASIYDRYFKEMLEKKGFHYELVAEFKYVLIMSRNCRIAGKEDITLRDLDHLIEIKHGDPYVPSLPITMVRKEELAENVKRRIFLFERGGQFDLLVANPETYMWVSPLPQNIIDRYDLLQRKCVDNGRKYKDVLIYRQGYRLSTLDKQFIDELCISKRKWLS